MPIGRPPYSALRDEPTDFFLSAASLAPALSSAARADIRPENGAARAAAAPSRSIERREGLGGLAVVMRGSLREWRGPGGLLEKPPTAQPPSGFSAAGRGPARSN